MMIVAGTERASVKSDALPVDDKYHKTWSLSTEK